MPPRSPGPPRDRRIEARSPRADSIGPLGPVATATAPATRRRSCVPARPPRPRAAPRTHRPPDPPLAAGARAVAGRATGPRRRPPCAPTPPCGGHRRGSASAHPRPPPGSRSEEGCSDSWTSVKTSWGDRPGTGSGSKVVPGSPAASRSQVSPGAVRRTDRCGTRTSAASEGRNGREATTNGGASGAGSSCPRRSVSACRPRVAMSVPSSADVASAATPRPARSNTNASGWRARRSNTGPSRRLRIVSGAFIRGWPPGAG